MKILKRTKGLLRFRTTEGTIVLKDGENELTDKEFKLIKAHPMYEAMVGTSGLVIVAEEEKKPKAKAKKVDPEEAKKVDPEEAKKVDPKEKIEDQVKEESKEVVKEAIKENNSEDGIDLSDINLESQDKKTLVKIANSLKIETKSLNVKQLIEEIKAAD
tara:strand:- start:9084 stop:9560 length:477 start_codon:yes stop_codon:yes gene_type:complete